MKVRTGLQGKVQMRNRRQKSKDTGEEETKREKIRVVQSVLHGLWKRRRFTEASLQKAKQNDTERWCYQRGVDTEEPRRG